MKGAAVAMAVAMQAVPGGDANHDRHDHVLQHLEVGLSRLRCQPPGSERFDSNRVLR